MYNKTYYSKMEYLLEKLNIVWIQCKQQVTQRHHSLAARGLEEHNTVIDVTSLLHCGTVT